MSKKKEKVEKKDLGLSDPHELEMEIQRNQMQNLRIGNSEVKMIGDKMILIQVVKLLAYIRYAVQNNLKTELVVKFGEKIANGEFKFDVNGLPIGDLILQKEISIN